MINILLIAFAIGFAGCGERNDVNVQLSERAAPQEPANLLEIQAQVAGPTAGLHYKWFAVSGECEPQESDRPSTTFRFAEGVRQDKVSVEAWRGNQRVAQSEIRVKFDGDSSRNGRQAANVQIEITTIPPFEPGGPDTHADIAGRVSGPVPADCVVIIYARAFSYWYIQPTPGFFLPIQPDKTWFSWTHTGSKYAALVVRRDFEPLARLEMLPDKNEMVLASTIVEGALKPEKTTNSDASPRSQ
ncbi:MAG TPA: hypothetical protein VH413_20075 [Verrucomicrobiae bacterium]|nr:hypothetical protein [Verrucomicrobiae bacterium]